MNHIQIAIAGGGMISLLASATPCEVRPPHCGAGETGYELGTIRRVSIVATPMPFERTCVWGLEDGASFEIELVDYRVNKSITTGCLSPDDTCNQGIWTLRSDIGIPLDEGENTLPSDSFLDLGLELDPRSGCTGTVQVRVNDVLGPDKQKYQYSINFSVNWEEMEEGACEALGLVPIGEDLDSDNSANASASERRKSRRQATDEVKILAPAEGGCGRDYFVTMDIVDDEV